MAHFQDPPPKVQIHLRPVLSEKSHQPGAIRLLCAREDCRRQPDSEMEKDGIREPVLSALHPDQGHKLWHKLHLPGAQSEAGGRPGGRMCPLRVPWLFRVVPGCSHLYLSWTC